MKNRNVQIIIGVLVALLLVGAFFIFKQQSTISEMSQQFDIQKEELEQEYEQLAVQYEGYNHLSVKNDSLIDLLDNEKIKVQRLLEELKTVKSSNARRISELKKELSTLRAIMKSYILQIDSLNQANAQLRKENADVKSKYSAATQTVSQLSKEKEKLTEKVDLASQLNAVNIKAEAIDKRGRETPRISRATDIKITFTIARNITTKVGDKYVYARIMKPDGDILVKNRNDVFAYENKDIAYSCKKSIEFDGEEQTITLYWNIEEFLYPGEYRVDLFCDGNMIGNRSFTLKK